MSNATAVLAQAGILRNTHGAGRRHDIRRAVLWKHGIMKW
jgi:hypothetical protein